MRLAQIRSLQKASDDAEQQRRQQEKLLTHGTAEVEQYKLAQQKQQQEVNRKTKQVPDCACSSSKSSIDSEHRASGFSALPSQAQSFELIVISTAFCMLVKIWIISC